MKWLLDFLKGKWLGHSLHPILAHVPMAMWPGTLILAFPEVPNFAPASFNPIVWTFKIEPRDRKVGVLLTKNHDQKT
jgi:hypothetical protein